MDRPAPTAPSDTLASAELFRSMMELSSLFHSAPLLLSAPRGDGHDVVVVPGFGLGDASTILLRQFLSLLGYRVHGWGLGKNPGARELKRISARFAAEVHPLVQQGRKFSLIGHSLGGVIARQYATRRAAAVRQVITLGSPLAGDPRAVNSTVTRIFAPYAANGASIGLEDGLQPLPVPSVAIYSQTDGILCATDCREDERAGAENIQVHGSHCGLIVNPAVFYAIADRLARAPSSSQPFRPKGWHRSLYDNGSFVHGGSAGAHS